jgi:GT2 family glycosyltransferase
LVLSRKRVLDKVGWFDEDYFLDGEDIDLCWRIKKAGWKIIYYPKVSILHLKGATKGKRESLSSIKKVSFREKVKYRMAGVNSMEIFVRKRLWTEYSLPVMLFVLLGIKMLKVMRILNLLIFDSFE